MFSLADLGEIWQRAEDDNATHCGQILRAKLNTSLLQALCHFMASVHSFPVNCYVSEFD